MEYVKLALNITFLLVVLFILFYNWLYAVRVRTSSIRIGMPTPRMVNVLISLSILLCITTLTFISVVVFGSIVSLSSRGLLALQ